MENYDLNACNEYFVMFLFSISRVPLLYSIILVRAIIIELLPAPYLPTTPIFSPLTKVNDIFCSIVLELGLYLKLHLLAIIGFFGI